MENNLIYEVEEEKFQSVTKEIEDVLSEELWAKLRLTIDDIDAESKLRISFVGQHNSGKSSIVRAITNNKNIVVSSNVETDVTTAYEWSNVIIYDTPGLYAGVKESHDEEALNAINVSDIIVFCITSSLFDDLLIKDFVDLAYNKSYKNKMVLVVNKMSQEDGEYDDLKKNYIVSLNKTLEEEGAALFDFPNVFIDAKDYREGIIEEDDELVELSHFDELIGVLNKQIISKGILGKLDTKYHILYEFLQDVINEDSSDLDKNIYDVYKKIIRAVKAQKRDSRNEIESYCIKLNSSIKKEANALIDKIGLEDVTETDFKNLQNSVNLITENTRDSIQNYLETVQEELNETIGKILDSNQARYIFEQLKSADFKHSNIEKIKDYSDFTEKYSDYSETAKHLGEAVANNALKEGAKDFGKLVNSSGSNMHNIVLNVGHFFGKSFKPWEAVKIAQKIGKVARFVGPIAVAAEAVAEVYGKVKDENNIKQIEGIKKEIFNSYSGYASDIVEKIEDQYKNIEKEMYDETISNVIDKQDKLISDEQKEKEKTDRLIGLLKTIKINMSRLSETERYI